jgi:hypothetical protein
VHAVLKPGAAAGQNLADDARLGTAQLSAREAGHVRASAPSAVAALRQGGRGGGSGPTFHLSMGTAALHAVLRNVPDEDTRRKARPRPASRHRHHAPLSACVNASQQPRPARRLNL